MANSIQIKFSGLEGIQKKLKVASEKIRKEADGFTEAAAIEFVGLAKRDAPGDTSFLRAGINYDRIDFMKYAVSSNIRYSGFVEFGTKKKVKIPPGLENAAAEVRAGGGSGSAGDALRSIMNWVKRKGIRFDSAGTFKSGAKKGQNKKLTAEQTGYIIYHFIMLNGIKAQPFFFKQREVIAPKLKKNLQLVLKNIL